MLCIYNFLHYMFTCFLIVCFILTVWWLLKWFHWLLADILTYLWNTTHYITDLVVHTVKPDLLPIEPGTGGIGVQQVNWLLLNYFVSYEWP